MSNELIERLAREANVWPEPNMHRVTTVGELQAAQRRFAALVAEQCAQIAAENNEGRLCAGAGAIRAAFPMPKD